MTRPLQPNETTTDGQPFDDTIGSSGQQKNYIVLSEEERKKGFVRPVRHSYVHVGVRPRYPTRELTPEEKERYGRFEYVAFEPYPQDEQQGLGRYWTAAQLKSGCGAVTTMGNALAETYARNPSFYGATFCCRCGGHFQVGAHGEFVWEGTTERVGT